jgi:DNA polymerase-3 subunit epsilon
MKFVAIDVETANADMASICQIGITLFCEGQVLEEWKTYLDPEDMFDPLNVRIHGIDEDAVRGAPTLPAIYSEIHRYMDGRVCVCHTHFDRVAICQAFAKHDLACPNSVWLDSARVARRAWQQFAYSDYGLASVCKYIGYSFHAHDALEDAKAAGHILCSAIRTTGLDLNGWLRRVEQPIDTTVRRTRSGHVDVRRNGNSQGPLAGEVLVITGALKVPRSQAAESAARIGCRVDERVTKRTTLLVIGDQDVRKLAGHTISSKHQKALDLKAEGQQIRIIQESDFWKLVAVAEPPDAR